MQYLRVLVVVLLTPLWIALVFPGAHAAARAANGPHLGTPKVGC